ncbi:oligopeptidase A [Saccharobesus litoralis]|uniref:oligopeptidase A n=1 Tax=Saccharobesus litoralis TaxID=2172099 RepID=A0A2S0VQR7_9ALTE|nr:oligopeptidase A [Saccharobesus litoralis]AWB66544.1 oligopeptidase A [Saccharobesus litoralis]
MTNPLLSDFEIPHFSQLKPEYIQPAIEESLTNCKKAIESALSKEVNWHNLVVETDEIDDLLNRRWSPVSHMHSVVNSDELRQAYQACLPLLSEFSTWVGQHEGLYQAYQTLADSEEFKTLNQSQQKSISNALRDFKLSGIGLDADKKTRYGEISKRLSELSTQFSNNVLDATQGWTLHITDEKQLAGLPESALAAAQATAQSKDKQGWLFTLEFPSYLPVMMYADNRDMRQQMYTAFATRASDQGPNAGEWDNTAIINETLALKHELAQLLGFANAAEKSLATKMAETPQQVLSFLNDLAAKSKPQAQSELDELLAFAKQEHSIEQLEAWDTAYYSEKLKQAKYAISDEELRPYFPEDKVLNGLFTTVNKLFGIQVTEIKDFDTWHDSVRFFEITDAQGQQRGRFYLDLYARENKRGGAWMDVCVSRRQTAAGNIQHPIAYLTCNFNKPVGDKPALFTHNEVVTLFHEFGHGIHHMLTQIEVSAVSGISGVAWDAVELPSQFLENWCWQEEALAYISGHYETGEPLPKALLDKMLAAKNFQSAMMMVRQLEFSLFDFRIHHEYTTNASEDFVQATLDDVRKQTAVITPPSFNRFQHSFNHIFAGGYAAGYYSYKWAEVLSADAFSRFEEEGIFNTETGQSFLKHILEKGGSQEPMELFKAFRGREPKVDALLAHSGIEV